MMPAIRSLSRFVSHARVVAVVRASLIVAIVIAGAWVTRSYVVLISEWRQVGRPVASTHSAAGQLDSMAAVLPLRGQWSFAELDWNMGTRLTSAQDVSDRFESMAKSPIIDSDEQLPDMDNQLVELIDKYQIKPVQRDGNQIYSFDQPDLKAQLVARTVAGREKAVGFAVAYPQADGHWQLVEFMPPTLSASRVASAPHLLPLPAEARRTGGRFDDDGRLLLELISLHSKADAIVSSWKEAGWEIRPSSMGDPDQFSYLCACGDEVVYAWSVDPLDAIQHLMLVRTANSTDTGR
jgi:hypothetical protein